MRTIIISDCHICPDRDSSALTRFLSSLECDRIIFAGDIFDLWEASFKDVKTYCGDTLNVIRSLYSKGIEVRYLPGEVDADYKYGLLFGPLEMPVYREIQLQTPAGRGVRVIHGHEHDSRYAWSKALDSMFSWATDRFGRTTINSLSGNDHIFAAEGVRADARAAWSGRTDILIMGHTHLPLHIKAESGKCELADAGDWTKHNSYVSIDNDSVSVRRLARI